MNELFNLKNRVIVVTGGTGVLGTCMVHYLASQGAKMAIIARNASKGEGIATEIRNNGFEAIFLQSDVNDSMSINKTVTEILNRYGQVDVLINAAGGNQPGATIGPNQTIMDLDVNAFKQVVDLNLFGTIIPTMAFAKIMAQQGFGNIINISSESAIRPLTRVVGYGAAKAAVTNFTKYLAIELATKFGENLRVNAIAPGFFISDQNRSLLTNADGSLSDRGKSIINHTPFKRFGEPGELMGTIHWLAADASRFVTGTLTIVDGGFDAFSI